MTAKKLNADLLQQAADCIVKYPKNFDMDSFINHCGTTGCIAGWVCAINKTGLTTPQALADCKGVDHYKEAKKLLNIEDACANTLFFDENWPDEFNEQFHSTESAKRKAEITAERIAHFINTGE